MKFFFAFHDNHAAELSSSSWFIPGILHDIHTVNMSHIPVTGMHCDILFTSSVRLAWIYKFLSGGSGSFWHCRVYKPSDMTLICIDFVILCEDSIY